MRWHDWLDGVPLILHTTPFPYIGTHVTSVTESSTAPAVEASAAQYVALVEP
jgi:hypothetical protein